METAVRKRTSPHAEKQALEGSIEVTRLAYDGAESTTVEKVRVPLFKTAPAYVEVRGGLTMNLGNYNSGRVDVAITMPCYPEHTEVVRCYEAISTLVDELLQKEESYISGDRNNDNTPA